jgi:uncharacterized protein with von Willebrand factor type A (vWA) domain
METRIVEFAEILRQNGVRVGTSEVLDAVAACQQTGLGRREDFRSALRTTMVKRGSDLDVFHRAFELYFSGTSATLKSLDQTLAEALEAEGLLDPEQLPQIIALLRRLALGWPLALQAAALGDRPWLAKLLAGAVLELNLTGLDSALQVGFFSRRLLAAAGASAIHSTIAQLETELRDRGVSTGDLQIVSKHLSATLRKLEEAARAEIERQLRARNVKRRGGLTDRPLHTLSEGEIAKMNLAVRKLAEKLKSRLIRRRRNARQGALSVRRTLRRNLSWGGVPMVPVFHCRRPERPEMIVICDVSDSVRTVSRLMLLFMYTLQSLFRRVRSFVFVSEIGEVTKHFAELDLVEAIDLATAGKTISLHANSNYGRALEAFARDQMGTVTRRTTVLIIGDGRNNYHPNQAWALDDLRRKARRLLWICPEPRRNWGFGDSEMLTYSRYCHQVMVVESFTDLEKLADRLLPLR